MEQENPEQMMTLPPWLVALRESMVGAIKAEDLSAIMQAQVDKAKTGDVKAAAFVLDQAHRLLKSEQKRVTIVQNNYYDTPASRPDTATPAPNGTPARIEKMAARASAHLPLQDARDGPQPISDDEEKELHRRQDEQED